MNTYHHIIDNQDEILFDNFPENLLNLISEVNSQSLIINININNKILKARLGNKQNSNGQIYVLTTEERYVNSSKLFRDLLGMAITSLNTIVDSNNKIAFNQNEYVQGLIHNLTSLNTYNIQNLFSLIPQQTLTQNINKQHEIIKSIISEKPNITVETLLKLIKYNFAMKVEFSVFEKTVMKNPSIQKMEYPIREIILSILQIFIDDFETKKIFVSVDSTDKKLFVDYDSLFVSLYYIFENAVKYCCINSSFKIKFKEESPSFLILLEMISIRINDDEITKLSIKNYRSKNAMALTGEGKGIGMYRIQKTLKLNNANLEFTPRISDYKKTNNNIPFEHNRFTIKFNSERIL